MPSDLDPWELGLNEVHSLILCAGGVAHEETKTEVKRDPIQKRVENRQIVKMLSSYRVRANCVGSGE